MLASRGRLGGLLTQLLVLVVFPTIVMLILVAYGGVSLHEHAMQMLVAERDERAVRAAAEALEDRFNQRRLVLQIVAYQMSDAETLNRTLTGNPDLRQIFDGGLVVTDADANVVAAWQPGKVLTTSLRSTDKPWVLDHNGQGALVVVNVRSTDGRFTVFGGISLASLNVPGTMGVMKNNQQTRLFLLADDQHIIQDSAGLDTGKVWAAALPLDAHDLASVGDPDLVTVWSKVETLGWTLIVQEPWNEVASPALKMSLIAPLAVIPAVLLAMGVLGFGLWRVVLPLRRLGRASARLSWGDYTPISQPVGGVQEVRELQENLRLMAQRLQQAQAGMHNYIGAMLQGQEEERKRLSREMHDDTLQSLIALDQQRQMAQRALDRDPARATNHLEQLASMMDQTIKNLRRLIRDMRPSYIEDLGLAPALEMLASQNNMQSGLEVGFTLQGTPKRFGAAQELGLYRIAQEALTNAVRHAAATHVEIAVSYAESFSLNIHDNGNGFSVPDRPGTFAQTGHYGLMGMVERAEQMGAQFRVDSVPGKGTTIEVRLPMSPQAQA